VIVTDGSESKQMRQSGFIIRAKQWARTIKRYVVAFWIGA
jgi:hypothetical protein